MSTNNTSLNSLPVPQRTDPHRFHAPANIRMPEKSNRQIHSNFYDLPSHKTQSKKKKLSSPEPPQHGVVFLRRLLLHPNWTLYSPDCSISSEQISDYLGISQFCLCMCVQIITPSNTHTHIQMQQRL